MLNSKGLKVNAHWFQKLWIEAWSRVLIDMTPQEIGWLAQPSAHLSLLSTRRISILATRVQVVASLFAVLTPLWIVVDISIFPNTVWPSLVAARILTTMAFVAIVLAVKRANTMRKAYLSLAMMFAVPTLFFLFTSQYLKQIPLEGLQAGVSSGYNFLPFVMLAGLSIFPLTIVEGLVFAAPILLIQLGAYLMRWPMFDWPTAAASLWLLMLIASVSILAGVSQLAFILVLVRESMNDSLTGCFSRNSGEKLLEMQYGQASRSGTSFALAFIDLDFFKQVNDKYGHDAGDRVLMEATSALRSHQRSSDILVRWGGEEFVLVMPKTDGEQAQVALERMSRSGFGERPDGTPLTASIGIAELLQDKSMDWHALVELADRRMYKAKQSGRNRIVGCRLHTVPAIALNGEPIASVAG